MKTLRAPSFKLRKSATAVLSGNGERIAQITSRVVILDVKQRKLLREFKVLRTEWYVALSHDGRRLAVKGENGELVFCDVDSGSVLSQTERSDLAQTGCRPYFSNDGALLIDGCWDGSIRVWNVASAQEVDRIENPGFMVRALAYASQSNQYFAVLARKGDVRECRIITFKASALSVLRTVDPPCAQVSSGQGWQEIETLATDPKGTQLVFALLGETMGDRNSLISLRPADGRYAIGLLPSRAHFVQGLACGSGGLAVAAVRENLWVPGMGLNEYDDRCANTEHSHLHFFETDTMNEICRWHWKDAWMTSLSEPEQALVVASRDEPGGFIAEMAFTPDARKELLASPRFRA